MMLSVAQIKKVLLTSICEANDYYYQMSGGEWITDRGVESFLAYHVSRAFKTRVGSRGHVMVEISMRELLDQVGSLKGRSNLHFKAGNRIDVVITDRSHQPIGVVELKRNVFTKHWLRDADRISTIMRRLPRVRFGAFAVLMAESKGDTWLNEQLEAIRSHVKKKNKGASEGIVFTAFEKTSAWESGKWQNKPWDKPGRYSIAGFIISRSA